MRRSAFVWGGYDILAGASEAEGVGGVVGDGGNVSGVWGSKRKNRGSERGRCELLESLGSGFL